MISSSHPQALQRYTAAHELGHHLLHREGYSLDGKADIDSASGPDTEREAQLFAAQLLLPPIMVGAAVRQVRAKSHGDITAPQAYEMSGLLGVSYSAMVHTLADQKHITRGEQNRLLAVQPKMIKAILHLGPRRHAPRTVDLSGTDALDLSATTVGDEVAVNLPENRTNGTGGSLAPTESLSRQGSIGTFPDVARAKRRESAREVAASSSSPLKKPGPWNVRLAYAPVHRLDRPVDEIELSGTSRATAGIEHANRYVRRFLEAEQRGGQ